MHGNLDMTENMKVLGHLKFYGGKITFETISFEQRIPNLVLYREDHEVYF